MNAGPTPLLTDDDYRRLAAFRLALRRYLRWAEQRAAAAGVTTAQHQLLLAIRARGHTAEPTVGELADELLLRHNSTVGLIDRAEAGGLVRRRTDTTDQRVVRVRITPKGHRLLARLAAQHVAELGRLDAQLHGLTSEAWAWPAVDRIGG
jgi:DNA-binding MarR family transcriptional regulator